MLKSKDIEIVCKDCKKVFIFTTRDQEYFKERGFEPRVRCKSCSDKRKNKKWEQDHTCAGVDC